ncbi:MAG: Gfo/Idh/MocA family oxidoreductase, partial [Candidatus Hydrogenedentota bacterium]
MEGEITRRRFVAGSVGAAVATTLAVDSRAQNSTANDRIRLGFIGTGNRGGQLLDAFMQHSDMEITAVCDVYKPHIEKAKAKIGRDVEVHADFRNLIGSKNVDAVVIATPDHWHAIQCIMACDAGKDVYVEKPLSVTIHEGRRMVDAARRNKRIVQVGTHRRSSPVYAKLAKLVEDGDMGHVTVSRAYHLSNMYPNGIGHAKPSEPPADLDWDMWLGPRAMRPYQDNICPYKFRWWNDFSSQIANNGIHYLDAIRWITGELAPTSVCAMGGHFIVDDDRTIPDTMEATFQFASGRIAVFGQYEASGGPMIRKGEVEIRGTQGTACISGTSFEVFPEKGGQFQSPEL